MKSLQNYVDEMNQVARELIEIATNLRNMSLQVISEEDVAPLQLRQEILLAQLEEIDQKIHKNYRNQLSAAMQDEFHKQMKIFQELNQEYIQNMSTSHGLIQFELQRIENQDEQDFSHLTRLNKSSSSPNGSQAIESEEDEES